MKFRSIMIALLFALASGVAFAIHCPADMKTIDAALRKYQADYARRWRK